MKWVDLKNRNTNELKELLADNQAELQNLNWQAHSRQLKQVHKVGEIKKRITHLKILLTQRTVEEKSKNSDK